MMNAAQHTSREELEKCLITWAHARRDIEELHRLHTPGAEDALALVFRIMIIGEKAPRVLASVADVDVPALAEAIAYAVQQRNACFDDGSIEPLPVPSLWSQEEMIEAYLEHTWDVSYATRRLSTQESPEARYASRLVQRLYTFGEPLSVVVQSVKEADVSGLVDAFDHAFLDDPTQLYPVEFRRTASDFHIPVAQWSRGEVQHLISFINRAHKLAEDMMRALDDPCFSFNPQDSQGASLLPEQAEGIDQTHALPNLDGVYKAIRASYFLAQVVEHVMRVGFSGDFLEAWFVEMLQDKMKLMARILAVPRDHWVLFDRDEFG